MILRDHLIQATDGNVGWFRFVCSNGLIIGVTCSDMRRRDVGEFQIQDIGKLPTSGLNAAQAEKKEFRHRGAEMTLECRAPREDRMPRRGRIDGHGLRILKKDRSRT